MEMDLARKMAWMLNGNILALNALWNERKRVENRRFWVLLAMYCVLSMAFWTLYPFISYALWLLNRRRALNAKERTALAGLPERVLDKIQLVERPHWVVGLFFYGTHACAIDTTLYIHEGGTSQLSAAVCRHEVTHVFQYSKHGFSAFLGQYFAYTLHDLFFSCSPSLAYKQNPFEEEALSLEDLCRWRANVAPHVRDFDNYVS